MSPKPVVMMDRILSWSNGQSPHESVRKLDLQRTWILTDIAFLGQETENVAKTREGHGKCYNFHLMVFSEWYHADSGQITTIPKPELTVILEGSPYFSPYLGVTNRRELVAIPKWWLVPFFHI